MEENNSEFHKNFAENKENKSKNEESETKETCETSSKFSEKKVSLNKSNVLDVKKETELNKESLNNESVIIKCGDNIGSLNDDNDVRNYILSNEYLIYDSNIFIFKMFSVFLLFVSRSTIEVRRIMNITDNIIITKLKNVYLLTFSACIFLFIYNSGKSYVKSNLTLDFKEINRNGINKVKKNESMLKKSYIFVVKSQTFISIKNLIYKSFVKYLLPGFMSLYFIQPFSYYISKNNPDWLERIMFSPVNFFLDSLDRIIFITKMDLRSDKIFYFSQILIYLFFARIICYPIMSLIKYTIEILFNEINQFIVQKNINTENEFSTIQFSNTNDNLHKKDEELIPLIKYRNVFSEIKDTKKYLFFYYKEQEFSQFTFMIKFVQIIMVLAFLLYIGLTNFLFIFVVPMLLPIITFNIAKELSTILKIRVTLAFIYLLVLSLFIFFEDQPFIWKSSLIFLLGSIDSLFLCLNKQYNHYYYNKISSNSLILFGKNILLIFFIITTYILFFKLDNNTLNLSYKSIHLLRENSILLLVIILSSHPFIQFKQYLLEREYGIQKINKENQKLLVFIFLHPLTIRLVCYYFELNINTNLSIQFFVLIITLSSFILTFSIYYILSVIYKFLRFIKNKLVTKLKRTRKH